MIRAGRLLAAALPWALAPSAAHAASEVGAGLFWQYLNLALLLGAIVYLARKPVRNYVAERRSRVQKDITSAEELLRNAEGRLAEWSTRAERLDADVQEIRRIARRRAEEERQRILEDATRSAERIRSDATAAVDREVRRAQRVLREEAADLAVELAEQMLGQQVSDADRDRLVDEFVERVEQRGPTAPPRAAGRA